MEWGSGYNPYIVGEATVTLDSRTAGRTSFPWAAGRLRAPRKGSFVSKPIHVRDVIAAMDFRQVTLSDGQPVPVRPMNAYYRTASEITERVMAEYLASVIPDEWVATEVFISRNQRVDVLSRRETPDGPFWTAWELKAGQVNNTHLMQLRKYLAHLRPILGAERLSGYLLGDGRSLTFVPPKAEERITVADYWTLVGVDQ